MKKEVGVLLIISLSIYFSLVFFLAFSKPADFIPSFLAPTISDDYTCKSNYAPSIIKAKICVCDNSRLSVDFRKNILDCCNKADTPDIVKSYLQCPGPGLDINLDDIIYIMGAVIAAQEAPPNSNYTPPEPLTSPPITGQVVAPPPPPPANIPPICGESGANTEDTCNAGRCLNGLTCKPKSTTCECNGCDCNGKIKCGDTGNLFNPYKTCCMADEECCVEKMCCVKSTQTCTKVISALKVTLGGFCTASDCPTDKQRCPGEIVQTSGPTTTWNICCKVEEKCGTHYQEIKGLFGEVIAKVKTPYCVKSSCDSASETKCTEFEALQGGKLCCPNNAAPCKRIEIGGGYGYVCSANTCDDNNEEKCKGKDYSKCCPKGTCRIQANGVPTCRA